MTEQKAAKEAKAIEPEVLPAEPAETKPAGRANILAIAPERSLPERATVIGTREGLRFMEWVVLDDWRSDFRVVDPRAQKAVQLNGILALDVACALAMRFGVRPAVPQEDGTEEGLKRRDAKAVIAGILLTYGYPLDYICNIIVERGTATISPDDAAAIEEATGGPRGWNKPETQAYWHKVKAELERMQA